MAFVQERRVRGEAYVYLEKSVRIGGSVYKLSKYIGKKAGLAKSRIAEEKKKFALEIDSRLARLLADYVKRKYRLGYPLTPEDAQKIEEMNIKYREIKKSLNKQDWIDVKKRFVANFVFESNALEGNSLTLKNFSDIVFEDKVHGEADFREVYDAKNSYAVFSKLFSSTRDIDEDFILWIHKGIMKDIDGRRGYKTIPNILVGRKLELTKPEDVHAEMKKLVSWYNENSPKMHPLELALKFHHKFERIHPFADGNGRVGRMLMDYILIKRGYFPLIIRKTQRNRYIRALEAADSGQYVPLIRFGLEKAKETYRKFFEVYYKYL